VAALAVALFAVVRRRGRAALQLRLQSAPADAAAEAAADAAAAQVGEEQTGGAATAAVDSRNIL
jgi:hypothetical protein